MTALLGDWAMPKAVPHVILGEMRIWANDLRDIPGLREANEASKKA